jgi:hypothetical protein
VLGGKRCKIKCFGRETAGRGQFGRSRLRWEDEIQMKHQEVGRGKMDWIDVAQARDIWRALVKVVVNIWVS